MKELKATDKVTQKMTCDGAVSESLAKGEVERISSREPETELAASPEESANAALDFSARRNTGKPNIQRNRRKRTKKRCGGVLLSAAVRPPVCNSRMRNAPIPCSKSRSPVPTARRTS